MSFVNVAPEMMDQAAGELERVGSTLSAANAAAVAPTAVVVAPAADEVSAAIAALMGNHAQEYQALSAEAARFHNQFVNLLSNGAGSYVSAETVNAHAAATSGGGSGGIFQSVGSGLLGELVSSLPGVEEAELSFDASGPSVVAMAALDNSQTAFVNAVLAGNPGAAASALVNGPANVANAFLYGQETVAMPLPLPVSIPGVSVALDIPFGGVLAPLQPISEARVEVAFWGEVAFLASFWGVAAAASLTFSADADCNPVSGQDRLAASL